MKTKGKYHHKPLLYHFLAWAFNAYIPLILLVITRIIITLTIDDEWSGWTVTPGDPTYNKPVKPDLIPSWANSILTILGPLLIMAFVSTVFYLIRRKTKTFFFYILDIHNFFFGFVASWIVSSIATISLKLLLGQPRPTFNANGARESFPSGHTTSAAMGFVFLIFYLAGKWNVYQNKSSSRPTSWWKMIILGIFLVVPIIVGVTRVRDFSHFPLDVTVGFCIGSTSSIVFYRTVYRWPWEAMAWAPLYY